MKNAIANENDIDESGSDDDGDNEIIIIHKA